MDIELVEFAPSTKSAYQKQDDCSIKTRCNCKSARPYLSRLRLRIGSGIASLGIDAWRQRIP
jgi:hypothetical protein